MQVQRRQPHQAPWQPPPKQQERTRATSDSAPSQQPGAGTAGNTGKEKPEKPESVTGGESSLSSCITDDEKVVEKAKQNLEKVVEVGTTAGEDSANTVPSPREDGEDGEGGEGLEREGGAIAGSNSQLQADKGERLLERFENIEKEKTEITEKIARLTQTMSVMQAPIPITDIPSANDIEPVQEASGQGESVGLSDEVARAAIAGALEDHSGQYVEPMQPSDTSTSGDGDVSVVHVVGEILGKEGSEILPPLDVAGSEPDTSGDTLPQAHGHPLPDQHRATSDQTIPRPTTADETTLASPSNQPITTTDYQTRTSPNQAAAGTAVAVGTEGGDGSNTTSSPPSNAPGSAVKTTRSKRQLAATFTKGST